MVQLSNDTHQKRRIFVFDNMRARSHLFFRWMATHPDLAPISQPFIMTAFLGADRFTQHTRGSERRVQENNEDMLPLYGDDTYASCQKQFEVAVGDAEAQVRPSESYYPKYSYKAKASQGKIPFANDHSFNVLKQEVLFNFIRNEDFELSYLPANPTHLPDWYFDSMSPVILIRNPLIQIPSLYHSMATMCHCRPGDEDFEITSTLKFCRLLFDHLRALGKGSIIVDAEDMLWRTDTLAANICARLRIDHREIKDQWDPIPEGKRPANLVLREWTKTMLESNGIERPDQQPAEPRIGVEYPKWVDRFGEEGANNVKQLVETNMPHYEYLKGFKS